jgi:hypothetical protein
MATTARNLKRVVLLTFVAGGSIACCTRFDASVRAGESPNRPGGLVAAEKVLAAAALRPGVRLAVSARAAE